MVASRTEPGATTAAPTSVLSFITAPRGVRAHPTQCAPVTHRGRDPRGLRRGANLAKDTLACSLICRC